MTVEEIAAVGRVLLLLEEHPGPLDTPCWHWPGCRNMARGGYGQLRVGRKVMRVHRLVYRCLIGEPPARAHLHHVCEVRWCANPAHLGPLPPREHVLLGDSPPARNARRAHCSKGHRLDGANLQLVNESRRRHPRRRCARCHREGERARKSRAR